MQFKPVFSSAFTSSTGFFEKPKTFWAKCVWSQNFKISIKFMLCISASLKISCIRRVFDFTDLTLAFDFSRNLINCLVTKIIWFIFRRLAAQNLFMYFILYPNNCWWASLSCFSVMLAVWICDIVSRRLWASSIMTTFPFKLIPHCSLVAWLNRIWYGTRISWESLTDCLEE